MKKTTLLKVATFLSINVIVIGAAFLIFPMGTPVVTVTMFTCISGSILGFVGGYVIARYIEK